MSLPTCGLAIACSGFFAKCSALEAVAAGAVLAALASELRTAACTASEIEGIDLTLTFLRGKRQQTMRFERVGPVSLGLPGFPEQATAFRTQGEG
ncbi:hypothetical protein ACIQ8G_26830 [Streptomyces sp. NPDC094154]|uniref:hypothetical protein n=1 Tax=Streptomyces sp. NPDC094154 TaxID=3366059 RepID=UPI0037F4B110